MSRELTCTISFVLLAGLLLPGTAGAADPNLVGWWRFDEGTGTTAFDTSGYGRDGTIVGAQWVPGHLGSALRFGGNAYVEVPPQAWVSIEKQVTVAFWAYGDPDALPAQTWGFGAMQDRATNAGRVASCHVPFNNGQIYFDTGSVAPATGDYNRINKAATPAEYEGSWQHWTFTKNATTGDQKIYLNGVLWHSGTNMTKPMGGAGVTAFTIACRPDHTMFYIGQIDDFRLYNRALTGVEIQKAMKGMPAELAYGPRPADGATDVPIDVTLGWTPGKSASTHDIYRGTVLADVNTAGRTNPRGVLASQGQSATTYSAGRLAFSTTCFWRVDEVNAPPDSTIFKGQVWSFTTEPVAYPLDGKTITATASSAAPGQGPENTVNSAGLTGETHGNDVTTMWLTAQGSTGPAWIQYQFSKLVQLHEMRVWNHNGALESMLGFGAKDVTIEYSRDGTNFKVVGTTQLARASGQPDYAHNTVVSFGDVAAKYVKVTITSNWGGILPQYGLSEVRFFTVPVAGREPSPVLGATNVAPQATLKWRPGREAGSHQVWLGTDPNSLPLAATVSTPSYDANLNLGQTYYWKIVEVNQVKDPASWAGDVWSFATASTLAIDDFESYTDEEGKAIFQTWIDGFGTTTNGAQVGNTNPPYAEQTIIHGGRQALPLFYNNSGSATYSEASRTFDPAQNWTTNGADTLSLWFRGYPAAFVDRGNGACSVSGGGTDIGGTADQFRFVYKQLSGDGSITARVDSQTNTHAAARAGVMMRGTLDPGSMHATLAVTPTSSITLLSRVSPNGTTTTATAAGALKAPYWVRVTRTGSTFKAECSPDGVTWTPVGTAVTLTVANSVYLGLAVSSHAATQVSAAEFSNVSTTGAVTGPWQVQAIGATQASNDPAPLYLTVEDKAGKQKTIIHADPAATTTAAYTEWRIPLSELSAAGMNMTAVKKLTIGVGNRTTPQTAAVGALFVDDIGYGHPAP